MSRVIVMLLASCLSISAWAAEVSPAVKQEVTYLLDKLAGSGCQFERNGTWYSSAEARAHLETKYRALLDRALIAKTEDFIERAATASSLSGQPYQVRCADGKPQPAGPWLRVHLGEYRKQRSKQ